MLRFPVTWGQKLDFNLTLRGLERSLATYSYQVNSSHFRGFFTGSDPVKNALFTGFEIFNPMKNTVKVQRFFTGSLTGFFTG